MSTSITDLHGRRSIPGMSEIITDRRAKQLVRNEALAPKVKNGITDPFTYYHVLDAIIRMPVGHFFTSRELVEALAGRPLIFDPVTVGRVLGDLAESLRDAYGFEPIKTIRRWDGRSYWTDTDIQERVAMDRLLVDLEKLCLNPVHSTNSPLYRCPSVAPTSYD